MPKSLIPTIALVGRTNVGKSTLFNRLIERNQALVSDLAGTTRDRKEGECIWRGMAIKAVDTGGLDVEHETEIERDVVKQAEMAMKQADIILFIVDMRSGPMPQDYVLGKRLMHSKKPVIVVGNKAEKMAAMTSAENQEWRFGSLSAPMPISAARGTGVGDLLDVVYEKLKELGKPPVNLSEIVATRIAVIGKPNVGKSSLLNAILGEERFITSPIAHTTREPNDVHIEFGNKSYILIDTAGIRQASKIKKTGGVEAAGVERTRRILKKADVVFFVVEANQTLGSLERTLAGLLIESRVGVVVVANKWDLVSNKTPTSVNEYQEYFSASLPFMSWAPITFVSAKTNQRITQLFAQADTVQSHRFQTVSDEEMDTFWRSAIRKHLPSRGKGPKPPTILGMKQTGSAPPAFVLTIKAKRLDVLHPSYLRFLENRLRERYDFSGTPVVINVRGIIAV